MVDQLEDPHFVMILVIAFALLYLSGRLAYKQWILRFRKFSPDELGRAEFESAAKLRDASWRVEVEINGITFFDWLKVLEENVNLLEEEMSRRGINVAEAKRS